MKRIFLATLAIGLSVATLAPAARAGTIWGYNLSAASAVNGGTAQADITGIGQIEFIAGSVLAFRDNDGSGGISGGDTFTDFIVARVTDFSDQAGNGIFPPNYGAQHELTFTAEVSGTQLDGFNYRLDSGFANFYYDSGDMYTATDFRDLRTVVDGTLVERADLLSGGGTNSGLIPDGAISIVTSLTDLLNTTPGSNDEYFELDADGNPLDSLVSDTLVGIFDGNNNVVPPANPIGGLLSPSVINGNAIVFGYVDLFAGLTGGSQLANGQITSLTGYDFGFHTSTDGSFVKDFVPEPGSFAIFSVMGLSVMGMRRRRN